MKGFQKIQNLLNSEMRTILSKIPENLGGKSNGTEIPGDKFSKNTVYTRKFRIMMFHLALETAKNSKRNWSIEKRPLSPAHTLLGSPRNDSLLRDDDPNKD